MALMEHDMNKIREEALKELARRNYIDYFYYANNCTFEPLRHQGILLLIYNEYQTVSVFYYR